MGKRTPFQIIKRMMEFDKAPKSYKNVPYNRQDWNFLLGDSKVDDIELDPLMYVDDDNPFLQEYARSLVTGSETKPRKSFMTNGDGSWSVKNCLDMDKVCNEYTVYPDGRISHRSPDGRTKEYDGNGNMTKDILSDETIFRHEYDQSGNRIKKIYPDGDVYNFEYDDNGNMIKEIFPNGDIYRYEYDGNGNKIKEIYPDGDIYSYEYDQNGRRIKNIFPSGRSYRYEYDGDGNAIKEIYSNGDINRYEYDGNGNVIKKIWSDGDISNFKYDAFGNVIK